jgi:hypothetical protein
VDSLDLVYEDEVLRLFWNRDVRYHISEWRGEARGERLRTAAHACLTASRERPSEVWLTDVSAMTEIDPADMRWIVCEYYPLLARNSVRLLVYAVPEHAGARGAVRQMPAACGDDFPIEFEYCDSRAEAVRRIESLPR